MTGHPWSSTTGKNCTLVKTR